MNTGIDRFRPDIQGLRAIAVLAVVAFHSRVPFLQGGFVGVDVFFVLSGFLITRVMLQDRTRMSGGASLVEFYGRRARRILPAATVVIAATLALSIVAGNGLTTLRAVRDAWAATFFFSNAKFAGEAGYFFNPNGPSVFQQYWSLSVEEQFYAIWPVLFLVLSLVAGRVAPRRSTQVILGVVAVVCAASFALNIVWTSDGTWLSSRQTYAFYLLWPRAWELGVGAMLALAATQVAGRIERYRRALTYVGIAAVAAAVVLFDSQTPFPGWAALVPTLGTLCLVAGGLSAPSGGAVDAALSSWPAQMLGRYSYSLYLWHWPVLQLIAPKVGSGWIIRTAVVVAVSLPAAILTYHLVEDPIRRGAFFRGSSVRSLAAGVAALVVAAATVLAVDRVYEPRLSTRRSAAPAPAAAVVATAFVPSNLVPRLANAVDTEYFPAQLQLDGAVRSDRPTIVVFGDSHGDHLVPGLRRAAAGVGADVRVLTKNSCPWFELPRTGDWTGFCHDFRVTALKTLKRMRPAAIVVSGRGVRPEAGTVDEWAASVNAALDDLPEGVPVLVVSETPASARDVPRCLAANLANTAICDVEWPLAHNERLVALAQKHQATYLDLHPGLCAGDRCPAINGNRLIWRDRDHLTAEYSATLAPLFRAALQSVLGTP